MNMDLIPEEIYDLIVADLTSGLTRQERAQLELWIEAADENRAAWKEACSVWAIGAQIAENNNDEKKLEMWTSIVENVEQRDRKKRMEFNRWMGMAASFVVLAGIFWVLMRIEPIFDQEAITLPQEEPTVTLAQGEMLPVSRIGVNKNLGLLIDSVNQLISYSDVEMAAVPADVVHELSVPKGGKYQIELADGSFVIVNAESQLKYFASMQGDTREVWLSGEAFFEVAHNPEKPFLVHTGSLTTKVLGTKFNVSAYEGDPTISVVLAEGSVEVSDSVLHEQIVPGQMAAYTQAEGHELKVSEVNVDFATGWTKDVLYFNDVTLDELMRKMKRWYDIDVSFEDVSLRDRHFTGGIRKRHEAKKVFSLIEKVNDVKFEIEGKEVIITQK